MEKWQVFFVSVLVKVTDRGANPSIHVITAGKKTMTLMKHVNDPVWESYPGLSCCETTALRSSMPNSQASKNEKKQTHSFFSCVCSSQWKYCFTSKLSVAGPYFKDSIVPVCSKTKFHNVNLHCDFIRESMSNPSQEWLFLKLSSCLFSLHL